MDEEDYPKYNGGYGCDLRGKNRGVCEGGGRVSDGMFHCKECTYDVCKSCYMKEFGIKLDVEKVEEPS